MTATAIETVICNTHGPMKRREHWWECPGFDGEGCDSWLTDGDVAGGISEPGVTAIRTAPRDPSSASPSET